MSLLLCMCAWSLSQDTARATVEDPPESVQARSWVPMRGHIQATITSIP